MGKKRRPRPAGLAGQRDAPRHGGPKGDQELDEEMLYDEVEQFHRGEQQQQQDYIGLAGGDVDEGSDDDDEEEGVFDLDVGGGSSSSEEEGGDDDDEEEEDEDEESQDDDEEDEEKGTASSPYVRGVNRAGLPSDEEEEEEDEEDEADAARRVRQWGKSKQQYYNADATDLEIGQDFADAEEEEAAAKEVERARYEEMDEGDYGAFDVEEESDGEEDGTLGGRLRKGKGKQAGGAKGGAESAGLAALLSGMAGAGDGKGVETATVARDLSRLSKAGKLQVLVTDAPELLTLLEEFKEKLGELRERVEPLLPLVRQGGARVTEEGVAYLEVKQQLLLNYCINLTYYLLLKAEGRSVRDHPVMAQLLELRAALEKLRPLDAKLRFHVDRLLRVAEMSREALTGNGKRRGPLSFRPNPDALVGKAAAAGVEGEEEDVGEEGGEGAGGGVYRPPRLAAVPYEGEEGGSRAAGTKAEERARKSLEKLRRSEILQAMSEQFSDKPETVSERASAGALERRRREDEEERRRYEEERFVRLVTSKKEKKLRRAAEREATRLETIADIGDFHELEESLAALGNRGAAGAGAAAAGAASAPAGAKPKDLAGALALQRAVNSLAQKEHSKKRRRDKELAGDADVPYRDADEMRVRRPVPEEGQGADGGMGMDAADAAALDALGGNKRRKGKKGQEEESASVPVPVPVEEDAYYAAVAGKRQARRAEKEALYAVATTYGSMEEGLADGEKRGINYQILKNRGLTAYKSKLNRNPRVKKREAFRKATIRRKGQVREVRASEAAGYGGEATGINARVVRVRGKK